MRSVAGFVEGGTVQVVEEVRRYDHVKGRVYLIASPNRVPRWVNVGKIRVMPARDRRVTRRSR
jgi:hypothetical protein